MNQYMCVYQPVAMCEIEPQQLRHALNGLSGKVIGFIDNSKPNFDLLVDELAELLVRKYGVARVLKRRKSSPAVSAPDAVMKELIEQCDAVITGSGD